MTTKNFLNAQPFPHLTLEGLFTSHLLRRASAEFDRLPADTPWVRYDSPDERGKRTFNRLDWMPPACREILDWLLSSEAVRMVESLTGMEGLQADPTLYGGGLHVTEPGGFLGLHLDNERHPQTGLARRLNLILYLTENWQPEWGGELELWDRARTAPIAKIWPAFGRTAIFETFAHSFHGQTKPLACPPGVARKSIAVYYWSEPRARARFLAPAGVEVDPAAEAWRRERSL